MEITSNPHAFDITQYFGIKQLYFIPLKLCNYLMVTVSFKDGTETVSDEDALKIIACD